MKSNAVMIASSIAIAAMILKALTEKKPTPLQKQNRTIQFFRVTK
jgi:hypothetical protein